MPTPPVSKLPAFHPLVHEITPSLSPAEVFDRLAALPHCIFFDSAQQDSKLGRFSYLAADPFKMLRVSGGNESPFVFSCLAALCQEPLDPGLQSSS